MSLRTVSRLFGDKPIARAVHLYAAVARDRVIVAAMHQNRAGIYYEQANVVLIDPWPDDAQLGNAFRDAFDAFVPRDADLRHTSLSDWPAYRASRLRSVREFERLFRAVHCYALNHSNAIVRASTPHPTCEGIELSVSFNPLLPAASVGGQLLRLIDAAT
jgi:hypothetical protein